MSHANLGELRPTTIQLREAEHRALGQLARKDGTSKAATVRRLLQREARDRGLWPQDPDVEEAE
jgi:hypothetical protein